MEVNMPQLAQQPANVLARTAQDRAQRSAQLTFELVPAQFPLGLHVPDRRLNDASPPDHGCQGFGDAPALA